MLSPGLNVTHNKMENTAIQE